jgi:hypothetical protein
MKTKRKRRKTSGYITGTHNSPKSPQPIKYRSSWEYYVCRFLDEDEDVLLYEYENFKIPYLANLRTKKTRNYIPDFTVIYKNGTRKIIEVKRKSALSNNLVQKKAAAAAQWCLRQSVKIDYEIWTEAVIFPIRKKILLTEEPLRPPRPKKKNKVRRPRKKVS